MNLVAIDATRDESNPPESKTPHGTSLIILRLTAYGNNIGEGRRQMVMEMRKDEEEQKKEEKIDNFFC